MKKLLPGIRPLACCGVFLLLAGCKPTTPATVVLAPPGPADLGPAENLSDLPAGAVVFDLKYRAQTGGADDIRYFSFWGYGGSENRSDPFLQEVRQKAARVYCVENPSLTGRKWAAVEHDGRQARAFYFDLDADGKLGANECIAPTRREGDSVEFITPDFVNQEGDAKALCRVMLRADFYQGNTEPNCMWSPAALLEGTAQVDGKPARLLIFQGSPGGRYDRYGSGYYSLRLGEDKGVQAGEYIPREQLSSLICSEGQFYHLSLDGLRSNGLPARAALVKDTSPTGKLTIKFGGEKALQSAVTSLFLQGVEDKTVYLNVSGAKAGMVLPEGTYSLNRGGAGYGTADAREWEVSFTGGPEARIKPGETLEVTMSQPTLQVRAVDERERYSRDAAWGFSFKKGTRIYLEPRMTGTGREVFSRFRQPRPNGNYEDRRPTITITAPDGKEVLSKTMEYG